MRNGPKDTRPVVAGQRCRRCDRFARWRLADQMCARGVRRKGPAESRGDADDFRNDAVVEAQRDADADHGITARGVADLAVAELRRRMRQRHVPPPALPPAPARWSCRRRKSVAATRLRPLGPARFSSHLVRRRRPANRLRGRRSPVSRRWCRDCAGGRASRRPDGKMAAPAQRLGPHQLGMRRHGADPDAVGDFDSSSSIPQISISSAGDASRNFRSGSACDRRPRAAAVGIRLQQADGLGEKRLRRHSRTC